MSKSKELDDLINSIMGEDTVIRSCKKYFIVMADYDTFVLKIYDRDRPNNIDNDDVIKEYMTNNYYGHSYEAIEINSSDYKVVEIE